jgi:hypothetical protein
MSEEQEKVNEAQAEGAEQESPFPDGQELDAETARQFMTETFQFVTQCHLEQSALVQALLRRGLITTEELNDAFQEVRKAYEQQLVERQMHAAGIDPSGFRTEEQQMDEAHGIDVMSASKPPPCATGGCEGRKPPTGHG